MDKSQKEDQTEKWNRIKDDIYLFCEDCNKFAVSLDIPVDQLTASAIRKYVEMYNEVFYKLEDRKNDLVLAVADLSDFLPEKTREDALLCLEQSMKCCTGVCKAILQMWVCSGGM